MQFKQLIGLALASVLSFSVQAENFGHVTVKQVVSIYDGDTFRVDIDGWPDVIGKRVPIRLNGVDTPEIRGKCEAEKKLAREAKMFTVEKLRNAKRVELKNIQRGKYFRIVADTYVDGASLGELLINKQLARRYDGKSKRLGWCGR
ncbi:thermonuclease family protein [Gayadomonas joobiniege]|uniref:thermonuclease family protein n=1 Tax=Gayadomonas joobiniege TaxID=1234606 RepID=UPI000369063D|nr:thermonuclease family protein [Gayadomonas joobiniege]